MDEAIRQTIQEDASRCQVGPVPWDKICDRLFDQSIPPVAIRRRSFIYEFCCCLAALVTIFGLLILSGFVSPVVARALEQVPAVGPAYDFFAQCTGLQSSVINDLGVRVNQTATDQGVTITITDVLFDQGRLDIGYMVTTERPDASPPLPADWKTQYFNNERVIGDPRQGTWKNIGNDLTGFEEIYPHGDLPETFNLRIAIHQIGDRRGSWLLTIPVSKQRIDAATKTVLPMQTVKIGKNIVTITKVAIGPSSTTIDYDVDQSLTQVYFIAMDDSGNVLRAVGITSLDHQVAEDTKIWMQRDVFESPKSMPKYLVLIPCLFDVPDQTAKVKIPLN